MPYFPPPYTQYTGIWKLNAASAAQGAGTWPVPPRPYLFTWGKNQYGVLGLGNTTDISSPAQVGATTLWNSVAKGSLFTVAIRKDGTLWSWGSNYQGGLGLGNTTYYSSPKQIGVLNSWSNVGAGYYAAAAIKTDGTLWTWGYNAQGQLGLGSTTSYSSPKQVGSLTNWSKVVCSRKQYFTLAIKTDGTLWSWGYNNYGQLGLGNRADYSSPKQVGLLTNWFSISCNSSCAIAIKTDGTLWAWGAGALGQLGLGNATYYSSPKQVGSLTNWSTQTSLYNWSTLAIKTDGSLWSWGYNGTGQLGLGNTTTYSSPKQVGFLTDWAKIGGANDCATAIKTDGTLWSWGGNGNGQLGLGSVPASSSPKQVGSATNWTNVFDGGDAMSAAIRS